MMGKHLVKWLAQEAINVCSTGSKKKWETGLLKWQREGRPKMARRPKPHMPGRSVLSAVKRRWGCTCPLNNALPHRSCLRLSRSPGENKPTSQVLLTSPTTFPVQTEQLCRAPSHRRHDACVPAPWPSILSFILYTELESRAECCCQAHPNRLFVHSAQKHTKHVYTYFTLCSGQGLLTHHTGEETMSQPENQIPTKYYKALVLRGWLCPPGDTWQCQETFLIAVIDRPLLASSRWRPGILLNTPQCTRPSPTTKNQPVQNVSGAKVEKHCSSDKGAETIKKDIILTVLYWARKSKGT